MLRPPAIIAGLIACALFTHDAVAQTLGQGGSPDVPWWRVAGALVLCLGLAVAGAVALRARLGGGRLPRGLAGLKLPVGLNLPEGGPRRLQLVETIRLSHQIDVCLIRCDDRHLLVAAGPQGVSVLAKDEQGQGQ